MQLNKVKDIRSDSNDSAGFLFSSLDPLWRLTRYLAILLDWCYRPMTKDADHPVERCLRIAVTCLALYSVVVMTAFEAWQTIQGILSPSWTDVGELVFYFVVALPFLQTSWNLIFFLARRKELVDFFEQFHLLEMEFSNIQTGPIRKERWVTYLAFGITTAFTLVGASYVILQPSYTSVNGTLIYHPYYLPYYQTFRDSFTVPFLGIFQVWACTCVAIMQLLGDLVPAFTYYHSGVVMTAICDQIRDELLPSPAKSNGKPAAALTFGIDQEGRTIHRIWTKYDKLSGLVRKANRLFGSMLLVDYGLKFFLIALLTYSVLGNLRSTTNVSFTLIHFGIAVCLTTRLISGVLLKSHLYRSAKRVSNRIASLINRHWFGVNRDQRKVFLTFQEQIDRDQLTAHPLDLFHITPALLLAMLSLTVSYIIILFQT